MYGYSPLRDIGCRLSNRFSIINGFMSVFVSCGFGFGFFFWSLGFYVDLNM